MPYKYVLDRNGCPIVEFVKPRSVSPVLSKQVNVAQAPTSNRKKKRSSNNQVRVSVSTTKLTSLPSKIRATNLLPDQAASGRVYVVCSICKSSNIRDSNWASHVEKVHSAASIKSTPKKKSPAKKSIKKASKALKNLPSYLVDFNSMKKQEKKDLRAWRESAEIYSSYMNYKPRDLDGSFGSLDAYEDYSEESLP